MAATPPPGGLDAIEHVIILMQENRSFDHYFGRLRGVRGFGDRTPLRLPSSKSVFEQPRAGGSGVLPFSARAAAIAAGRPESDIQYLGALPHGFGDATRAWAEGWWNDWVAAKGQSTMAYYDRRDIPLQYELAERFTICDAYFCSVHGSTNPNRNYLWTGTTGYEPDGVNRAVTNAAYSYSHAGYSWTTYPERLEKAGISWQIYQEWDNFTDNAVEYFVPFKQLGRKILAHVSGGYRTTEEFYDKLWGKTPEQRAASLRELDAGIATLSEAERKLFNQAMRRSEPETLVPRLRADIKNGKLPAVSWLVPSAIDSEHPSSSTPVGSANLIYEVLDAIASSPETWSKTALLINFDENDGYFDHMPAPTAPRPASGNDDDWFNGRPIGLGPRVPMTIVSPWTVGGFLCSEVFDHTSTIQFLEKWTGVKEPNISTWRRAICGDLTSAFDFGRTHPQPVVEQPGPVPAPISRWNPRPPEKQALPQQESGTRPARALPYRLALKAEVTDSAVELQLSNDGTVAATVIGYAADGSTPKTWLVPARGAAEGTVTYGDGGYDLRLHGPGWSMWALRGNGVAAEVGLVEEIRARALMLYLTNPSSTTRTLLVGESVYSKNGGDHVHVVRLKPGQKVPVRIDVAPHGWYDVVVVDRDDPWFLRRASGRLADGRPGVTDPATGVEPVLAVAITLPSANPSLGDAALVQGVAGDVVLTLTNTSDSRLVDLSSALHGPSGWTAEPAGQAPTTLAAGASVDVHFRVTPAANATVGDLAATAHADGSGLLRIAEARAKASVAPVLSASLSAPASSPSTDGVVLSPGKPLTVTATVTNAGHADLTRVAAEPAVPNGWIVTPSGDAPTTIAARSSVPIAWDVTPTGSSARSSATLTATVTGTLNGSQEQATAKLAAKVGPDMTGYLLAEDFESVASELKPAVDLNVPAGMLGWTRTPPSGWSITNAPAMPQGTQEEQGWSFMSKQFWFASDGQDRSNFTRGLGIVAVADPDDWDDHGSPSSRGRFDSTLTSPAVAIPAGTSTLYLGFDSHYRQESPQEAEVTVAFDTGQPVQVLHYSSATSGNTNHGQDQQNRFVSLPFSVPSGATTVKVSFRIFNAGNNWYWSLDHIRLGTNQIADH